MSCDNISAMQEKSLNKFRVNFEAIIEKYSQPYDESQVDVIDLETLTICCDRGQLRSTSYRPRRIGRTRLAVEDHIELDMTNCTEKCTFNISHINCSMYEQSTCLAPEAHFPNESMQQSLLPSDIHNSRSVLCHSMYAEPEPSDAETLSDESEDSDGWETEDEAGNRKRYGSFSAESSSDDFVVEEPSSAEKLSGQVSRQESYDAVEPSKASCSPGFKTDAGVKPTPTEQSGFNLKNYIHLLKGNSSSKTDSGDASTACVSAVSKRDRSKRDLFNDATNTANCGRVNLLGSADRRTKNEQSCCLSLDQNGKPVSQKRSNAVFLSTGIGSGHSTDAKMGEPAANRTSAQNARLRGATVKCVSTSREEFSGEDSRIERRYRESCPSSTGFSPVAALISPACKRPGNLDSSKNATVENITSPRSQVIQAKPFVSKSLMEMYFRMKGNISCSSPSTVSTSPLPDDSNAGFPDRLTDKCDRALSESAEDTITGSIDMLSLGTPGVPSSVSSGKQKTENQEKASCGLTSVAVNDAKYSTSLKLTKAAGQSGRKVKTEYLGAMRNTLPAIGGPRGIKTGRCSNSSLSPSELLLNLNLGSPNDFGSKSERRLQNVDKSRTRQRSESAKTKADVDFDKNANFVKPGFVRKLQFSSNNSGRNSSDGTRQKQTIAACADPSDNVLNKRIENATICSAGSKVDESFNPTRTDAGSFRIPARCPILETRNDVSVDDDDDDDEDDYFVDLLNETDDEIEAIVEAKSEFDDTSSNDNLILVGTTSTPTKDTPGALFEASFISSISESSEIMRVKEIAMKALDETICSVSSIDCTLTSTVDDKITSKDFGMPSSENLMRDDTTVSRLSGNYKTLVSVPTRPYSTTRNETYLVSTPEITSSVPAKLICSIRLEKLVAVPRHFSVDGKAKVGLKSVELRDNESGILNGRQTRLSNFRKTRPDDVSFEQKRRASKRHRSSSSSSSDVEKKTLASKVDSDLIGIKPHAKVRIAYNTRQNASPGSYKNAVRVCRCCSDTK